jgi:hypothetical protein
VQGPNVPYTNLDQQQILQRVFDESQDKLRTEASVTVEAVTGEISVEIDAADGDNIAIANADGSKKVTVTTVGSKQALDVNLTNPQVTVSLPTVSNVTITTAGVEQSFNIPSTTKRFSIKIRENAQLNVTYAAGASGSNYLLVPIGSEYLEENLALNASLPIYFQANKGSVVLEIVTWS